MQPESPLEGKLFHETGDRLSPSHTKKKTGQWLPLLTILDGVCRGQQICQKYLSG